MENQKGSSDGEDIPSDFFDDFNKDEFMEGLSVIDSWDNEEKKACEDRKNSSRLRIDAAAVDKVRDLRELIGGEEDEKKTESRSKPSRKSAAYEEQKESHRSSSSSFMDDFIKPGSRRDPNKTNEAIKKDKEVKVKEYLAKHLESGNELCPPGTELDDFFENTPNEEGKNSESRKKSIERRSPRDQRSPPARRRRESHDGDLMERKMKRRLSPLRFRREPLSPRRQRYSPHRLHRPPPRYSPQRNVRKFYRKSPRRASPEMRRERRSRSPYKRYRRHSRSRSPGHRPERDRQRSWSKSPTRKVGKDDFLYPRDHYQSPPVKHEIAYAIETEPQYVKPMVEYGAMPNYTYAPVQAYGGYAVPYEYGVQSGPQMIMPVPQPVPAPIMGGSVLDPMAVHPIQPPTGLPTHVMPMGPTTPNSQKSPHTHPDALAKLVADGTLSHEDYLKLAPNKGVCKKMDTNAKVAVMKRCHNALSRLGSIMLPNQLLINNALVDPEAKQIAPKFCSPLKRQATTEFPFTKHNESAVARQNKWVLDAIISALGLEKVVGRKKKIQKETKDVAVQTMKPFCDVCEIRDNMRFSDAGTSIDRESFVSTVHTQVVEKDLYSSKSVFAPSGVMGDSANISIAHMTPAQLVSQLAARAKTLKQSDQAPMNHYRHQNYDYDGRGGDSHHRNFNYRY